MKSIVKKLAAGLTACLCLVSSLTGCYSEDKAWSAKRGDDTAAIGVYIYYLSRAYSEALGKVEDSSKSVFDQEIDGKDGTQWVKDRARESVKMMYYVDQKFEDLGLTLTEEDESQIASMTSSAWAYSGTQFEKFGIAKTSLEKPYSEFIIKYQRVFNAMYGEGDEKEVSDEELRTYYEETYTDFDYITCSYKKTNEDGTSEDMTDEEKAEAKKDFEAYVSKIQDGSLTMEKAAEEYQEKIESDTEQFHNTTIDLENNSSYFPEDVVSKLESMKEGDVASVDLPDSNVFYILRKNSIAKKCDEVLADEEERLNVLSELKGEEYAELVESEALKLDDITFNDSAVDSYGPQMFFSESDLISSESSSEE